MLPLNTFEWFHLEGNCLNTYEVLPEAQLVPFQLLMALNLLLVVRCELPLL